MGDFHALALCGKQCGMVADYVAAANGGKTYGLRVAFAGVAFAAVYRALFQITAKRIGNHFTHP